MGLGDDIVESLSRIRITEPTEVQSESIPVIFSGKDTIIRAKTGTGKTLAFLLPCIQKIKQKKEWKRPHMLVLAPTRELALQTSKVASDLIDRNRVVTVYGGSSMNVQIDALRNGADIVVGTPGRIIDLVDRGALKLDSIEYVVMDEADIMLDMGFIDDVEYILNKTPQKKQAIMLSATIPKEVLEMSKRHMRHPEFISVGSEEEITVSSIKHMYSIARGTQKFHMLLSYIERYKPQKCIIFLQTKRESEILHNFLVKQGIDAILMHGGLTQARRTRSLGKFRHGVRFLIATNVAARGLDIDDISDIINFDIPDTPNTYVHRVGRSARMGKDGRAFSIISKEQIGIVRDIEFEANIKMEKVFLDTKAYEHIPVSFHVDRHMEREPGMRTRRGGYGERGGFRDHRERHEGRSRRGGYRENKYGRRQ